VRARHLVGTGLLAAWSAAAATPPPLSASPQRDPGRVSIRQWTADVVVSADCDGILDGSRVIVHNRIATTYVFTRRTSDPPMAKWTGRATTTYRWAVGTEFRDSREAEEGAGSFDADAELELTDVVRITVRGVPARHCSNRRSSTTPRPPPNCSKPRSRPRSPP
jgi:hypothetical protein